MWVSGRCIAQGPVFNKKGGRQADKGVYFKVEYLFIFD